MKRLIMGTCGNSIFVMIAKHFRAGDCMDAGGRATQDAKAEEGSLCGINDQLSTKITKRGREKWISGGALMTLTLLGISFVGLIHSAAWAEKTGLDDLTQCSSSPEYRDELKKYGASLIVDTDYSCLTDVASLGEAISAYQLIDTRTHNAPVNITDAWRMPVSDLKNKKFLQGKSLLLIGKEFSRTHAAHDCATLKKAGFTAVKTLVDGAAAWEEYKKPGLAKHTYKMVSAQALVFEYFNGHPTILATSKYAAATLTELGITQFNTLDGNDPQKINDWVLRTSGNGYNPVVLVTDNASADLLKVSYKASNVYHLEGGVDALRHQLESNVWINHNRADSSRGFICGKK